MKIEESVAMLFVPCAIVINLMKFGGVQLREEKAKENEKRREEKEKKRREKKEKRRAEKEEKEKKRREKEERRKARRERRSKEKRDGESEEGSSVTAEEHGLADVASPSSSCYDSTANTTNNRKRKGSSNSNSNSNSNSSVVNTPPTNGRCSLNAMELQYKNLLQNLFLPQQPHLHDDDDWLYQQSPENKRQRIFASDDDIGSTISCSRSLACAQYLHQIDAFALPYVVPF